MTGTQQGTPTAPPTVVRLEAGSGQAGAALLAALHADAFADPAVSGPAWNEGDFAALLATPGTFALVAGGDAPAGFVLVRVAADEAEILTLGVASAARRRGTALVLLAAAVVAVRASGAVRLFLEVAETNAAARALYRRAGFAEAGRRRGYFILAGRPVDAVVMALDPSA